jgi:elongation factor Ts
MSITAQMVKQLRERTNAGMMDCKKALAECGGDMDKAVEYLRMKGIAAAAKKEGRQATQGIIDAYIHPGGRVGVLIEVACETDFVARTTEFKDMVHNIAMHIAASSPLVLRREDIEPELVQKEKEIYRTQMLEEGKPENIIDKIVLGKLEKYYGEVCLLEQKYVKDTDLTVQEYLNSVIGRLGENMLVKRFARFEIER